MEERGKSMTIKVVSVKEQKIFIKEEYDMKTRIEFSHIFKSPYLKKEINYYYVYGVQKLDPMEYRRLINNIICAKIKNQEELETDGRKYILYKICFEIDPNNLIYIIPKDKLLKNEIEEEELKNYAYCTYTFLNGGIELVEGYVEKHVEGCRCKECNNKECVKGCKCNKCKKTDNEIDDNINSDSDIDCNSEYICNYE